MRESNPLWQDIIKFSRYKKPFALGFIMLGIVGLILPIIPGVLLLTVGLFLLKPEWYQTFRKWFEKKD